MRSLLSLTAVIMPTMDLQKQNSQKEDLRTICTPKEWSITLFSINSSTTWTTTFELAQSRDPLSKFFALINASPQEVQTNHLSWLQYPDIQASHEILEQLLRWGILSSRCVEGQKKMDRGPSIPYVLKGPPRSIFLLLFVRVLSRPYVLNVL